MFQPAFITPPLTGRMSPVVPDELGKEGSLTVRIRGQAVLIAAQGVSCLNYLHTSYT